MSQTKSLAHKFWEVKDGWEDTSLNHSGVYFTKKLGGLVKLSVGRISYSANTLVPYINLTLTRTMETVKFE